MKALDAQAGQRDVVIKLSTGSGKTVVGLVYAEMMRRRNRGEPVVYLCSTSQLVDQVVQTGQAIGVHVSTFPSKSFPYEALSGDTVLACTYDKLFNSRSAFESKSIRPSAFVLDDIHAGIERVRQCYTATVPSEFYDQLRTMLRPLCESTDPATWRSINKNAHDVQFEVPYWVWAQIQRPVLDLLENYKDHDELRFRWDNINRYAELARVCISGVSAEISLPLPAVEENSAYSGAKHRLFMSASIKDGSSLISDLACDPAAFGRLIEPAEDAGTGERMILPTSLISRDVTKKEIAALCKTVSKQSNVVVLTNSISQARVWEDAGGKLACGQDVDRAIEALRASMGYFMVFAQRFDGVDLADDACRILVVDGVPSGDRLCDRVDSRRQKDSPEYDVRTVNRFEQALGRAVRSSADYAAVLLVGTDIAAFIGRKSVRDLFEVRTRIQVDLGRELAKIEPGKTTSEVLMWMIQASLTRNEDWKEAHRARVKGTPNSGRQSTDLTLAERVAVALRQGWMHAKSRNFQAAIATLRECSNDPRLHPVQKAEIIYRIASYLHQFNPGTAADAYRTAFEMNSDFPRPEKLADKRFSKVREQAIAVCAYFGNFVSANAAIAKLDEIRAKLSFSLPADTVEQGLHELGIALGSSSTRPEKQTGRGPDNLWIFDDVAFCIEAKNEKYTTIHKSDASQLYLSFQWCSHAVDQDPKTIYPVFATDVLTADRKEDIQFGPLVLTERTVFDLVEALKQLVLGLSFDGPLFTEPPLVGKRLAEIGLGGRHVVGRLHQPQINSSR